MRVVLMDETELRWGFNCKIKYLKKTDPFFKVTCGKNALVHWTNGSQINVPMSYYCYETSGHSRNYGLMGVSWIHLSSPTAVMASSSTPLLWNDSETITFGSQFCREEYKMQRIQATRTDQPELWWFLRLFQVGLSSPRACGQCLCWLSSGHDTYTLNNIITLMTWTPEHWGWHESSLKIPGVMWNVGEFFQRPVDLLDKYSTADAPCLVT